MNELRGLHLHFDCPSGAAGDMMLGALFDLGVPEAVVREQLAALPVGGYALTAQKCVRAGMAGVDVKVRIAGEGARHEHHHQHAHDHEHAHEHDAAHAHDHEHAHEHDAAHAHDHRHYADIRALVDAHTTGATRTLALAIFDKIAVAEAKLHGVAIDEVAFHEVGAIDSIVDVVGSAAALAWLAPASVSASPVAVGHGSVKTAHGLLPVPAPATLEILRAAGAPFVDGGLAKELCTPTGAAILATVVERWGAMPPLEPRAIGYGAGDRDLADRPNLLRAIVGAPIDVVAGDAWTGHDVVCLEANLDDMSPELCEHVGDRLFAAGALDVWWTPAVMKKSRPAFVLGVVAPPARRDALADIILAETTTLGVRAHAAARRVLERRTVTVATDYGTVVVKLGVVGETTINVAPEYESCRAIAAAAGVPLKEVYAAAVTAFRKDAR